MIGPVLELLEPRHAPGGLLDPYAAGLELAALVNSGGGTIQTVDRFLDYPYPQQDVVIDRLTAVWHLTEDQYTSVSAVFLRNTDSAWVVPEDMALATVGLPVAPWLWHGYDYTVYPGEAGSVWGGGFAPAGSSLYIGNYTAMDQWDAVYAPRPPAQDLTIFPGHHEDGCAFAGDGEHVYVYINVRALNGKTGGSVDYGVYPQYHDRQINAWVNMRNVDPTPVIVGSSVRYDGYFAYLRDHSVYEHQGDMAIDVRWLFAHTGGFLPDQTLTTIGLSCV